jgi:peptide/nickel transport system permease protein
MNAPMLAPEAAAPVISVAARPPKRANRVVSRLLRDKVTVAAMLVFVLIVLLSILAPYVTDAQPYSGSALERLKPVGSPGHLLGTDELGRDMWTRLVYGSRLSLVSGAAPVVLALMFGGGLGVMAGYAGGRVNSIIMRTMDVFYAFPAILLAIAVCAVMGTGLASTIGSARPPPPASAAWTTSRPPGPAGSPTCRSFTTTSCPISPARCWSTPPASPACRSSWPRA